ncbi:MAG TPA: PQQ-dependent sugar dehydrogenase [Candidatus Thermoplasmatota archaeon]|nr:PQQ-dependent sugar dehydrogenase [Candidatus Thermoplasmatota archaeon]
MRPVAVCAVLVTVLASSIPGQGSHGGAHVEIVASGLLEPVHVAFDGVDDDLMYISERAGRVLVYDLAAGDYVRDVLGQPKAFLDVRGLAGSWFQEIGLLSIAFHPDYAENGFVYVGWVDQGLGNHVDRFTRSLLDPLAVDLPSRSPVLFVQEPFPNHNGGLALFGPDGYLYYGLGDGGLADDPLDTGQDPSDLLGSILRLDVDSVPVAYAIPPDNPFATPGAAPCGPVPQNLTGDAGTSCPEVWAYGLRNPWRFSFDGDDLWIGDVGQNLWEEIDFAAGNPGGVNYGWKVREGAHPYRVTSHTTPPTPLVDPVTEFHHSEGCSVTGGHVYRGTDAGLASLVGKYTFADYCSRTVWSYDAVGGRQVVLADSGADVSTMGEGPDGTLYVAALGLQSSPVGGWVAKLTG